MDLHGIASKNNENELDLLATLPGGAGGHIAQCIIILLAIKKVCIAHEKRKSTKIRGYAIFFALKMCLMNTFISIFAINLLGELWTECKT